MRGCYVNLLQKHSISRQEYDDADAQRKQAQADVPPRKLTSSARINLGYTKITAQSVARIGTSAVTEGAGHRPTGGHDHHPAA
ncbi:hypothetical protein PCI56_03315 [Plesiomonas shigelloides subsp. oncorhynchi]|nr:hypothetical protein [Plesiomonas shigelloides]